MGDSKPISAPTAQGLHARHHKAVQDLFATWHDMAEAALSEPTVTPAAPHVRLAIAAMSGIPFVGWLQADNTVGWKIAMPVDIRRNEQNDGWLVLFKDPTIEGVAEALAESTPSDGNPLKGDFKIDLSAPNGQVP